MQHRRTGLGHDGQTGDSAYDLPPLSVRWSHGDRRAAVRGAVVRRRTLARRQGLGGEEFRSHRAGRAELAVISGYRTPVLVAGRSGRASLEGFRVLARRSRFQHLGLRRDGSALLAVTGDDSSRMRLLRRSRSGALSHPRRIRGAGRVSQARLALDESGRSAVAWMGPNRVGVALGRFGDGFDRPVRFRSRPETGLACSTVENTCVDVALAGNHQALLAWRDRSRLRVARYRR